MNIKTMYRDEWTSILEKKVIIKEFSYGDQKGKMSLLKIQKVTEPLWVGDDVKRIKIAEVGHSWLQIALENGFFWITAMFDENDKPFEIYIDMTNGNHTEGKNPYFEDMYLDYALSEDRALELDKDELEEALREGKITKEQYERTLACGEKLYAYLKNNKEEFRAFIQEKFQELTSNAISIVPNGPKYLESTDAYARDKENTKYMMFLPNESKEETLSFLENAEKEWQKEKPMVYEYAILLGDVHIGAVSFDFLNEERTEVEMGWIVNKRYWGHGYAFQAAKIMVDFCIGELGVKKFIAHCDTENVGSYRTMEKLGMKRISVSDGRKNRGSEELRQEYRYELII